MLSLMFYISVIGLRIVWTVAERVIRPEDARTSFHVIVNWAVEDGVSFDTMSVLYNKASDEASEQRV
jgi:hypothetical protein